MTNVMTYIDELAENWCREDNYYHGSREDLLTEAYIDGFKRGTSEAIIKACELIEKVNKKNFDRIKENCYPLYALSPKQFKELMETTQ